MKGGERLTSRSSGGGSSSGGRGSICVSTAVNRREQLEREGLDIVTEKEQEMWVRLKGGSRCLIRVPE